MNVIIIMGIGVSAIVMFWLYRKMIVSDPGESGSGKAGLDPNTKCTKAQTSQEFILFDNIENRMLKLGGKRFRAYLRIEPVNWDMLTFEEQDIIQDQFMKIINSIRYPIDLYIGRLRTDVKRNVDLIMKNRTKYGVPEIEEFGEELAEFTNRWVSIYALLSHGFFLIVYYDEIQPRKVIPLGQTLKKRVTFELDSRCDILLGAFNRIGLTSSRLDDIEIAQLLMFNFNRDYGALYSIKQAMKKGIFSWWTTSNMGRREPVAKANLVYGVNPSEETGHTVGEVG